MIEIHMARAEERQAVERLWEQVYGDGQGLREKFFQLCAPYENTFVLTEDGQVRSFLCAPEMTLCCPNGRSLESGYMYALATDPEAREKGFGRATMRYGAGSLKSWGADCAILVPAEPSLFRFFDSIDYVPAFSHVRQELIQGEMPTDTAGGTLAPAEPEEYNEIRRRWLAGRLYADCSDKLVAFQQYLARACGGDIYRLTLPGGDGCAVVELDGDQAFIKELLCAGADTDLALALLRARHPAEGYVLRLPPWTDRQGERVLWGAVLWLHGHPSPWCPEGTDGYLGLTFD